MDLGSRRASLLLFAIAFAFNVPVQASEPASQITGRVVRADTGAPVEGAAIRLMPPIMPGSGQFQTAITDSNGNYSFLIVRDGTYEIGVSASGFVPAEFNRAGSLEGAFQRLDSSTHLRGIDFRLVPEATIRGTVAETDGKPAGAGVSVAAVRVEKREDGSERRLPVAQAQTDVGGRFVLKGLAQGSYFVVVNGPDGPNARRDAGGWYRETWYINSPSFQGALQIALKEGQQQSDIRVTVAREQRFQVVVWPSGPEGEPNPDQYSLELAGRNHSSMKQRDGSYVIPDVPPGHYKLFITAWSGVKYVGEGDAGFDISDDDVTVKVHVGGLGEIQGRVMQDGPGTLPAGVMVGVGSTAASQVAAAADDGHFAIGRVLPGDYTFRLVKAPGFMIRRVQCSGLEVTADKPLTIGDKQKVEDCEVRVSKQAN
jgi:5-hydroxyisourate hydrolase-like protein (transthyretin family)